jgi:antitoxin component of MazEF toxin-antitoxin module
MTQSKPGMRLPAGVMVRIHLTYTARYVNICLVARDIVKLRRVAGSMVISIPHSILSEIQISEGDRVLIEASSPHRLVITKEMDHMPIAQRAELELAVLEARKAALGLDSESKVWQHNNSMELDLRLTDGDVFTLTMMERNRELAEIDVEIAKKRLEIFELQGAVAKVGPSS